MWENRGVSTETAMDGSFNSLREWRNARAVKSGNKNTVMKTLCSNIRCWQKPPEGTLKCNVDASFYPGTATFSIGMAIRDCRGEFVEGRNMTLMSPDSVFEAECIGVREALSWIMSRWDNCEIMLETDSLLTVEAVNGTKEFRLEVGHVVDHCQVMIQQFARVKVSHIRKQANRVAHGLARLPCSVNCLTIYSSPPTHLVETLLFDMMN